MKTFLASLIVILSLVISTDSASAQYAGSCDSINQDNYDACCVTPGDYNPSFQPSQACVDFKNNSAVGSQGFCATVPSGSPKWLDAGCDKGYLLLSGQLETMCKSLQPNTPRWINLGCSTATPAGGSIGGGTPYSGPQYSGGDTGSRTAARSSSEELSSCNAIKFKSLLDILIWIKCIIVAAIIPLIFVLAFLFFLWGILRFMMTSDQKNKEESKKMVWAGLIGLFVMVSVWGIIKIVGNVFGIESAVPLLQTDYLDESKASR